MGKEGEEGARPGPELSLVFSDSAGHPVVFPIPEGTTTLGTAQDNDLVLDHESVEAHQIVLHRRGVELELRDLFAGETRVNDERRRSGRILPGDVLTLGSLRLRVMKVAPRSTARLPSGSRRLTRRRRRTGGIDRPPARPPSGYGSVEDEPPTRAAVGRRQDPGSSAGKTGLEDSSRLARERDARRARSLARARQISDEVMSQDDFEVILERLSVGFLDVFGGDRAVGVLFEEDGRNPLLVVERRRDGTAEGAGVAQEIIDRCLQVRSVIRVAGGLEGLGGLAAPLIAEGRALGLLYFERNVAVGPAIGADDVHLMAILTNFASLKIAPLVL